jgi:phospholipid/cholesterol/gamma-HCH transport system substrate-binding protein
MRRIVSIFAVVVAVLALVIVGTGSSSAGGDYKVRGIFDNGGFIVPGEDVRVAGAKVGTVDSVDVTRKGETASLEGGAHAIPGKAVVVMKITDPGFADFRRDASCLIRPQSLIGEKYIDCQVTAPRAPGSQPPPPLHKIADGEPGAGQYLLPIENNGKAVDLDLINNIQRLPFAERFRLIINDLGASLAGRGPDLAEVVRRADPALRQFDRVLAILAEQNHELAKLNQDSDEILAPLARDRASVSGFLDSAGETAQASAERSADIEQGLQKFPRTLQELRSTMRDLGGFSKQATPVFRDFGRAAPSLAVASKQLAPFATATNISVRSLGNAAEQAGPLLVEADSPTITSLRDLARSGSRPLTNLGKLTKSLRTSKGFDHLMTFIYNNGGWANAFDSHGHMLRENFLSTNCIDYSTIPLQECKSNWKAPKEGSSSSLARTPTMKSLERLLGQQRRDRKLRQSAEGRDRLRLQDAKQAASQNENQGESGNARDVLDYLLGQ